VRGAVCVRRSRWSTCKAESTPAYRATRPAHPGRPPRRLSWCAQQSLGDLVFLRRWRFAARFCARGVRGVLILREAHFFAVPLLSAPTHTLCIDDAGSCATAPLVVLHPALLFCRFLPCGIGRVSLSLRKTDLPCAALWRADQLKASHTPTEIIMTPATRFRRATLLA
jgi:hypothetical protein